MSEQNERTVFIVDDDASVCKALSRLLQSAGFRVETFHSGEQLLARTPICGCGCILLDVHMPGRSGIDLQQELARSNSRLPVIFITGYSDAEIRHQAMRQGAVEFLTKPVDDKELLRAVESAFHSGEPRHAG